MENKAERLKLAKETKIKILNHLHGYEKKTKIFHDMTYHSLKTKKEKDEYVIKKWSLKETFKIIDEIVENPEKFREMIEKEK
ncbi:hypothetical protein ES705_39740 [subsurface metagenome]